MARNQIVTAPADVWTELTANEVADITLQVLSVGKVRIAASEDATAPAADDAYYVFDRLEGEVLLNLLEWWPGITGVRLFAFPVGADGKISVSHA